MQHNVFLSYSSTSTIAIVTCCDWKVLFSDAKYCKYTTANQEWIKQSLVGPLKIKYKTKLEKEHSWLWREYNKPEFDKLYLNDC